MKPIGPIIKRFLEENDITQIDLAKKIGKQPSYLSAMLQKSSMDAETYEKICQIIGMHPMTVFDYCGEDSKIVNVSDLKEVSGITNIGNAAVNIGDSALARVMKEKDKLIEEKNRLIEEKERTIRILMRQAGLEDGA
ncbi:MAG: helix-turn-helix domain-containing protein [Muribaculaceae bacterium]|nr:helix-turn-helix domain-containing protein [Muribaculaceae bacterium]